MIGQQSCACVLTGNKSDISISVRRTQGFDILMLMFISRPSSQAHNLLVLMLASLVRTGLLLLVRTRSAHHARHGLHHARACVGNREFTKPGRDAEDNVD